MSTAQCGVENEEKAAHMQLDKAPPSRKNNNNNKKQENKKKQEGRQQANYAIIS